MPENGFNPIGLIAIAGRIAPMAGGAVWDTTMVYENDGVRHVLPCERWGNHTYKLPVDGDFVPLKALDDARQALPNHRVWVFGGWEVINPYHLVVINPDGTREEFPLSSASDTERLLNQLGATSSS